MLTTIFAGRKRCPASCKAYSKILLNWATRRKFATNHSRISLGRANDGILGRHRWSSIIQYKNSWPCDSINVVRILGTAQPVLGRSFVTKAATQTFDPEETIRHLTSGDFGCPMDPTCTNIVLVVGNTGHGKTTLTRLLVDFDNLESYDIVDDYLIRDTKSEKISDANSTMVSKTAIPELIVDPTTPSVGLCDLPGFCDTRNADTEISNAYYTKKVFDHATQVKILIVAEHSSVRRGRNRSDFKTCLEHITELVEDPLKFSKGFGLVATKVESNAEPQKIIEGIALYLESARATLPEVFHESPEKILKAQAVIDSLLTKNLETGAYDRILFFKNPSKDGPLISIPQTVQFKSDVENLIHSVLSFVPSSSQDFGISVSPRAKLRVLALIKLLDLEISKNILNVTEQFEKYFASILPSSLVLQSFGTLWTKQQHFSETVSELTGKHDYRMDQGTKSLSDFVEKLQTVASNFYLPEVEMKLQQISRQEETRQVFQKIIQAEYDSGVENVSQLIHHLQQTNQRVNKIVFEQAFVFSESVQEVMHTLRNSIENQLHHQNSSETYPNKSDRAVKLAELYGQVERFKQNLSLSTKTYNQFARTVHNFVISFNNATINANNDYLLPLQSDNLLLTGQGHPFKVRDWIVPIQQAENLVREETLKLNAEIQQEHHQLELARLRSEREKETEEKKQLQLQIQRDQEEFRLKMEVERQRQKRSILELLGALAAASVMAMIFGPLRWARRLLSKPIKWALIGPTGGIFAAAMALLVRGGKWALFTSTRPVRWVVAAVGGLIAWLVSKFAFRRA